jgi:hypothetical protein
MKTTNRTIKKSISASVIELTRRLLCSRILIILFSLAFRFMQLAGPEGTYRANYLLRRVFMDYQDSSITEFWPRELHEAESVLTLIDFFIVRFVVFIALLVTASVIELTRRLLCSTRTRVLRNSGPASCMKRKAREKRIIKILLHRSRRVSSILFSLAFRFMQLAGPEFRNTRVLVVHEHTSK